jgi:lipopolysaccharide/colanic/teichoic acid biosynthesis glycosyltransferase
MIGSSVGYFTRCLHQSRAGRGGFGDQEKQHTDVNGMSTFQTTKRTIVREAYPSAPLTELDDQLDGRVTDDRHISSTSGSSFVLRAFDLSVCLLVLPMALVIGAITALLIYIDSPGSVLYRSKRVGQGGHTFEMLKFRKMRRHARGGPLTFGDDERFTPIGNFLSLTKLDELPQLWNVIRGEMHLVGPRPEVPEFVARYPREYHAILSVLPGITGPAAVEYASESHLLTLHDDPMRFYEEKIMPRKLQIDLQYIHTRTLRSDVVLLTRTAVVPFTKVLRNSLHNRRTRRIEASLLLGSCALLALVFALASSGA